MNIPKPNTIEKIENRMISWMILDLRMDLGCEKMTNVKYRIITIISQPDQKISALDLNWVIKF